MQHRRYRSGYIRKISDLTDHETAMKFAYAFGGKRVRIPKRADNTLLASAVGTEAAMKISEAMGDEEFDCPIERSNLIFWLRDQGKSTANIAHDLRMSPRGVQYRLSGSMLSVKPLMKEAL